VADPSDARHPVSVAIRTAASDDAASVAEVYVESWNAGFRGRLPERKLSDELIERWRADLRSPDHRWWVAVAGGAVVGFAGIGPSRDPIDPSLGELDTIGVAPEWWRRGIGSRLMDAAIEGLEERGYSAAVLWTLRDHRATEVFYTHQGWRRDGATRADGGEVRFAHRINVDRLVRGDPPH
jgi:GNAT superfamily N-acetyltransferase